VNIFFDSNLSDDARRMDLYRGSIFLHSPLPSALRLLRLATKDDRRNRFIPSNL